MTEERVSRIARSLTAKGRRSKVAKVWASRGFYSLTWQEEGALEKDLSELKAQITSFQSWVKGDAKKVGVDVENMVWDGPKEMLAFSKTKNIGLEDDLRKKLKDAGFSVTER